MPRVLIVGPAGRSVVELEDSESVGRDASNSIQLLDQATSKRHCTLERDETGFRLRDLGSANGTFVNGVRIDAEYLLSDGDTIVIGNATLRFEDDVRSKEATPIECPRRSSRAPRLAEND